MSSVKMIGIAEHCDLSCDWIIKAIFLRRSLHRLWHSAASVTQDKSLLRLDCTLHQWCNYEIDVVLIQISIWKPVIDRYRWLGGSSWQEICSAGADDEFGPKHTWFLTHDHATCTIPPWWSLELGSHFYVAGGKYEEWFFLSSSTGGASWSRPSLGCGCWSSPFITVELWSVKRFIKLNVEMFTSVKSSDVREKVKPQTVQRGGSWVSCWHFLTAVWQQASPNTSTFKLLKLVI